VRRGQSKARDNMHTTKVRGVPKGGTVGIPWFQSPLEEAGSLVAASWSGDRMTGLSLIKQIQLH
jgi:hypothetical protein